MVVRKMLDMVFSQHDLAWVDDVLPEKGKKKKEDEKKNTKKDKKKGKGVDDSEDVSVLSVSKKMQAAGIEMREVLFDLTHKNDLFK